MRRVLTKSLNFGTAAGFVLILACCLLSLFRKAGIFALLAPLLLLAGIFVWRLVAKMKNSACTVVFIVMLATWGFLVFLLGVALEQVPAWDFGRVQRGAWELIKNGYFVEDSTIDYFLSIPNNFFVVIYLYRFIKMLMAVGMHPADAVLLLNTLSLTLSILFVFLVFQKLGRPQQGLFTAMYCFIFAPMLLYASIYYTDTLSMPYVCAVLYLAVCAARGKNRWSKVIYGVLAGLSAGVGFLLKASPAIALIAIVICAFLAFGKKSIPFSAISVAVFALVAVLWQLYCHSNPYLSFPKEPYHGRLTASHYIMMGLRGNGGYSAEDHAFSSAIPTLELRKTENMRVITERVGEYGFSGMLAHLRDKTEFTWADGGYYAPRKIAIEPVSGSELLKYLSLDGTHYTATAAVLAASQLLLLFLLAFGACRNVLSRESEIDVNAVARLAVLGLAVFLLIWETRSRYLINFTPYLALLASNEIISLSGFQIKKGSIILKGKRRDTLRRKEKGG